MAYYVVGSYGLDDGVYLNILDAPKRKEFHGIKYEDDPATLDLTQTEKRRLENGWSAMGGGFRVKEDHIPQKIQWVDRSSKRAIPDVIQFGYVAISERFKDLIEKFEPGVHQFFPVEMYRNKKEPPVATYYWINVCNRVFGVNREKTTYERHGDPNGHGMWLPTDDPDSKLVFNSDIVRPFTLWIEPEVGNPSFYCSEAFGLAAMEGGFKGLGLFPREEG